MIPKITLLLNPNVYSNVLKKFFYLCWYALTAGFDGFLRWLFNSWVKDPIRDSRFRTWPAGDTYMVYPEGRSSIRYERMVEGIQDYVKARMVIEELKKQGKNKEMESF